MSYLIISSQKVIFVLFCKQTLFISLAGDPPCLKNKMVDDEPKFYLPFSGGGLPLMQAYVLSFNLSNSWTRPLSEINNVCLQNNTKIAF